MKNPSIVKNRYAELQKKQHNSDFFKDIFHHFYVSFYSMGREIWKTGRNIFDFLKDFLTSSNFINQIEYSLKI
jgi:hypothetical protein